MLVEEADRAALKDWVVPKLEKISDADAEVLADYVIALIVAEDTEDAVRRNCLESLSDFLQDHTAPFIDEVLTAVNSKSFLPRAQPPAIPPATHPIPTSTLSAEAQPFNPPTGPAALVSNQPFQRGGNGNTESGRGEGSRKRRYNERENSQPRDIQDPHYKRGPNGERPRQMPRRGGKSNRAGFGGQDTNMGMMPQGLVPGMPTGPIPNFQGSSTIPPGFDPMSFLAMMGMAFPALGGMAPSEAPAPSPPFKRVGQGQNQKGRCRDYDTKGFCALGSSCPYEHGGEIVLPPTDGIATSPFAAAVLASQAEQRRRSLLGLLQSTDNLSSNLISEYDPNQATLALPGPHSGNKRQAQQQNRARPDNGTSRGSRARAAFSQPGPNFDQSRSAIVVEQIPEDNFTEEDVRGFFSQFGNIIDIDMRAYKRLAIVKYDDYFAARRAYDSPKVIFDNRFVKVYWYKPESLPTPPSQKKEGAQGEAAQEDEEMVDTAELEKRQADAQKAFEERQRKAQEADARFEELERKLKENEDQARVLREELAKKARAGKASNGANGFDQDDSTLIDQLSTLQAEAQNLNADYDSYSFRGRGRGSGTGYRGRGFAPPRGRGYYAPFRGGYRGRGYHPSPFAGSRSSVKRLDNRPKRVAVSGVEAGTPKDEALRHHLLNNFEYESIEPHPDRTDTQIITFKERYMAEMFLGSAPDIPDVGKIEMAWVSNAVATTGSESAAAFTTAALEGDTKTGDTNGGEQGTSAAPAPAEEANGNGNGGEADYDVADDEDRWMAT